MRGIFLLYLYLHKWLTVAVFLSVPHFWFKFDDCYFLSSSDFLKHTLDAFTGDVGLSYYQLFSIAPPPHLVSREFLNRNHFARRNEILLSTRFNNRKYTTIRLNFVCFWGFRASRNRCLS